MATCRTPSSLLSTNNPGCLQLCVCITTAAWLCWQELLTSWVWSLVLLLLVVRSWGGDNFLTSASSVLPVPALSSAATPAPAAASAVAPPTGAPSAALVAFTFAVGVAAAFPVAIKVTALALFAPPVVTIPVWLMSEREYILVFNCVKTEEDDRVSCILCSDPAVKHPTVFNK